jgi:hypothetical protein
MRTIDIVHFVETKQAQIYRKDFNRWYWMLAMTAFKYLLAIFIAASWYASEFLYYLLPTASFWLFLVSLALWFPLFFFSLSALLRRKWRTIVIFAFAWALAVLPIAGLKPMEQFRFWLEFQGFRIHVAPIERYLSSRCRLIPFVEDGVEQQLGDCEVITRSIDFWDQIFYDTTGQFALPPKQRTPGWKDAAYNFFFHCYLTDTAVASRVFGKFHIVTFENERVREC